MSTFEGLKYDASGLVTVVVQDELTGEIRMLAHATREALEHTEATGKATFWSRSRQELWIKGETSGNAIAVRQIWRDCDGDAVVYVASPNGPSCHTGKESCFFEQLTGAPSEAPLPMLHRLEQTLRARQASTATKSYTKSLFEAGPPKIAAKVREEGGELAQALESETDERVVSESADVLYHLMVGLLARGLCLKDVEAELARRVGVSGHVEKASRG
jgi:phosphoribosyl-ATP pyrophosphohydrolase/phosphoribosyl-AMP cyclohydrolase